MSFTTADGLRLRGWYVPSKNGAAVISFPGRKGTQKPARMLAQHGYGVLLFDRRGEGESDGDPNALGWGGYRDVDAAVALPRGGDRTSSLDRIGGIGLSVGGEMMLEAAARSHELNAVVSEGAGERSIREYLDMTVGDKWVGLPSYADADCGPRLFSDHTAAAEPQGSQSPVSRRRRCSSSTASTASKASGTSTRSYYAAAGAPKQIWEVPGSGHVGGIDARPKEYERRVVGFFDRALLREN